MTTEEREWVKKMWQHIDQLVDSGRVPRSKNPPFVACLRYRELGMSPEQAADVYTGVTRGPALHFIGPLHFFAAGCTFIPRIFILRPFVERGC